MANTIAQLAVKLALETSEFIQGIEKATNALGKISEKIEQTATIGAAAFAGLVYKSLEFSDQISDLSDATGISIAKILQLSDALEMSGGHFDDASKVVEKFAANIDAALQTSKPMRDAFDRIGVSVKDLKTLTTEDLLKKTTAGIAKLGDEASMTGAKVTLFGKGMRGVDMKAFNEEVQKGAEEYQKYQDAIATTADMHDKLARKTLMLTLSFTQQLMPTVSAMFDVWTQKGGAADKVFEYLRAGLLGLWYAAGSLGNAFAVVGAYWDKITGKIDSQKLQDELRKIYADQVMFRAKLNALDKPAELKKGKDPLAINRESKDLKDAEAEKQKQMLYTASLISIEYQRQVDFSIKQLQTRDAMVGMTNDQRKIQETVNQQLDMTSKKIDEITKAREAAAGRGANEKVLKEYDDQIVKVKQIGDEAAKTARKIETASIEAQRTFGFGWDKAFAQYAEDSQNYAKNAEESFSAITGNMTSALDKFVDTGKLSFSDFASSVIKDLIKIQLRMQMMQLFSSAFGGLFGGFSSTSVAMGGSGGGGGFTGVGGASFALPAAATGGTIDGPTLVGENGPELFIPGRSGSVIPNNTLANAMGGGGVTYNGPVIQSMQAIDTQSGLQFLAKNKMTIWSMNQSASRSIPTSR
jgi:lambda family phage tail tape measure protein